MSCIQKLLEMKGDKEFMKINSNAVLEGGGSYKGFDYCVTLADHGHRCGYVAISENHPFCKKSKKKKHEWDIDLECHGGITFFKTPDHIIDEEILKPKCDDFWLGFDAAHAGDQIDILALKKAFQENDGVLEAIMFKKKFEEEIPPFSDYKSTIRTFDYMEKECKSIIDQIIITEKGRGSICE